MRRAYPKVFLSFIVFLLILELVFFFKFRQEFKGYSIGHLAKGRVCDSPYTVFEPVRNTLNLKARYRQNNYGFRNEYDVLPKEENEFRIFILGGSGVYGQGSMKEFIKITGAHEYPSRYTIAAYLENKLSEDFSLRKITVFNAAVSGFTISQEYSYYMHTIRKLEPDMLILMDGYNDMFFPLSDASIYRSDIDREAWGRHPYKGNPVYVSGMYLMSRSHALFYLVKYIFVSKYNYDERFFKEYSENNIVIDRKKVTAIFKKYHSNIDRAIDDIIKRYSIFKETCRIDDVDILYCPQPVLSLRPMKNKIEKACRNYLFTLADTPEEQLPYLDMYEYFLNEFEKWATKEKVTYINLQREVNKVDEQIFIDYCHLTYFGNKYIAELIADKIKKGNFIE